MFHFCLKIFKVYNILLFITGICRMTNEDFVIWAMCIVFETNNTHNSQNIILDDVNHINNAEMIEIR